MPWWTWCWVGLMALITATGAAFDVRDREPVGRTALGLLTGVGCLLLVLSHHGLIVLPQPLWVATALLIGLLYEAWNDAQPRGRSEPPGLERGVAIALNLALFLPAVVLSVIDAWNGS
jgi:hypothetical protein